jgi:hypothetical protein
MREIKGAISKNMWSLYLALCYDQRALMYAEQELMMVKRNDLKATYQNERLLEIIEEADIKTSKYMRTRMYTHTP